RGKRAPRRFQWCWSPPVRCSKDDEFAQPRSGVKKIAHGASRGIAAKSAISPGRGVRMGDQTAFFFRRYAAFPVQTALPTAGAVGYFLPLLRSYSFGHPLKTSKNHFFGGEMRPPPRISQRPSARNWASLPRRLPNGEILG